MTSLGPRRVRRRIAAVSLAVVAFALAVAAILQGLNSNDTGAFATAAISPASSAPLGAPDETRLASPSLTPPTGVPSTRPGVTPPTSSGAGIVAVRIEISRLGIDMPIVEGDGIDAPLHKAAHYPGSAWPDGGSNIYLYAHAQPGMFLSLWEARVGDRVILTLADSSTRTYRVEEVMPRVPWNAVNLLGSTPVEQLTLQTSTSNFATAPRFVVIALPER